MRHDPGCDLSVIIPFADDEDRVGQMSLRIATHLRSLGVRFEILAVDEGSSDNSVALLWLLRETVPSLRLLAGVHGKGFAAGAREARGRALLLWDPANHAAPLGPLAWAQARLASGCDVAVVPGRFALCRRTAAWRAVDRARGRGRAHERSLLRAARKDRLRIDVPQPAEPSVPMLRRLLFWQRA
jgi:hypothetical protein